MIKKGGEPTPKPAKVSSKSASGARKVVQPRKPTNLTLDTDGLRRAEQYAKRRGTSVSQIVSELLKGLPDDAHDNLEVQSLAPPVRRLYGVGTGKYDDTVYHSYLKEKYGGKS